MLSAYDEFVAHRCRQVHPPHRDVRIGPERILLSLGMVSPDGVKSKPIAEPLLIHMGGTDDTVYYDAWLGKYVSAHTSLPGHRAG